MRAPILAVVMAAAVCWEPAGAQDRATTTSHPPLPSNRSDYWLVPEPPLSPAAATARSAAGPAQLAKAIALIDEEQFAAALPLVTNAQVSGTPLASYGR